MPKQREYSEEELLEARHSIGLYSIKELCLMFNCSRFYIDKALNEKSLKYLSPNNRDRYIYLKDFLALMSKN